MSQSPEPGSSDAEVSITVSLVHYQSDPSLLAATLQGLDSARHACLHAGEGEVELIVVDNTPAGDGGLESWVRQHWSGPLRLLRPGANLGFGVGHNLALAQAGGEFHLILNPDVIMESDALQNSLAYLRQQPAVAMISPYAKNARDERVYLCKRYPSVADLLLRGFAPHFLRRWFSSRLARYEYRGETEDLPRTGVRIASGCYLFARLRELRAVGGFSPRFFLYFEDFDLSLRLAPVGRIDYLPAVRIVHHGGNSARKGMRHIALFARSARRFFSIHGWRWW